MLRFLTAGESHGKGLVVIIEGMPAGVPISAEKINYDLQKRQKGVGSGGRMMIETDQVEIISGVRFGKTLGSPISLFIENKDFKNWGEKMSSEDQSEEVRKSAQVTNPRPGHGDLAGVLKYGFDDVRNVLERASARETTARVAAGAIFKQLLEVFNIQIASHTLQIGKIKVEKEYSFEDIKASYENDPDIRCIDPVLSAQMKEEIQKTRSNMDTLGGVVETWAVNVPPGLGSHVHFDRKIDGQLAQALMSIQSVKAVEIGNGVGNASQYGSNVHDEIYYNDPSVIPDSDPGSQNERDPHLRGNDSNSGFYRTSNRAGGIEAGITNGMPVIVRVYHKPISTLYKPMNTVDIQTKEVTKATVERSDICIVPRGGVVSEAMVAYILASNFLEKFGNDNLEDIKKAYQDYMQRIK